MNSLGNVPNSYMTALNGWTHDRWSATVMLDAEAVLPIAVGVVFLVALRRLRRPSHAGLRESEVVTG